MLYLMLFSFSNDVRARILFCRSTKSFPSMVTEKLTVAFIGGRARVIEINFWACPRLRSKKAPFLVARHDVVERVPKPQAGVIEKRPGQEKRQSRDRCVCEYASAG